MKLEQPNPFSESIEKAQRFDYRKISEQVKNLIEILSHPQKDRELTEKEIKEKYTQISDRAFRFLTSGAFKNLPENEKEIVLFYLLSSPSPKTQDEVLVSLSYLFKTTEGFEIKDSEVLERERKDLIKYLILQEALEGAIREGEWYVLLDFFKNPENQDKFPDIFQEALEEAIRYREWYILLNFFKNLEKQDKYQDILKEVLEGAIRDGRWDILLDFFKNPENQSRFPDIFKEVLEGALKEARIDGWWSILLEFFENPENQDKFPDIFQEALEGARSYYGGWYVILDLFFKNPENQDKYQDIFKEALEGAIRRGLYGLVLLEFFKNQESQKKFPDILSEVFKKELESASRRGWWDILLYFFENQENQDKFPDIFQEALEGARRDRRWDALLSFYRNPENQKVKPDIFQEALEGARRNEDWGSLLSFYQNPENQDKFPDIFQEALEGARRDRRWDALLSFYRNPENQPKINESFIKAEKSLFSISDKNLRGEFLTQMIIYLSNNESLALISLSRAEDLPLLITGQNLGIDPFVIQSWNLSEEERESLLPIFISLAEKGIKFEFPFPYYPRKELKRTRKHNEMLISYFRTLDFILSLSEEIKGADLIQGHFKNIKKIGEEYKIKQTTLDISYRFLREILTEIKNLEKTIIERIKEFLKISPDISYEEIKNFIIKSPYPQIILTLAAHYSKIYRDGLTILAKITSSLIKDPTLEDYFQMRYDLNDPITLEQLNPLLEGKSPEKYPQIVEKWRNPYYTFKILSQEEREIIETTEINWDKVWNHIKSQTYDGKHYEQLFELEEFKKLDEENKNKIREIIDILFSSKKQTINLGEIKRVLQGKLTEKKISILIGYFQFLKDLSLKQKTPKEMLSSIERLNKNIQENWQEFGQLTMWQLDIYNYLTQLIEEREKGRKIIRKQTILLSYFTDHPKTLLEIGKYPISTCQDYESTGDLNKALLGYVLDAHIKALVLREIEIETEEEINEEDLNQAKVNLDEEKDIIKITLTNGKTIKGRISKPIARRIMMLGKKEGKATLLLEPIYSRLGREDETYEKFLDAPLEKIRRELNLEITESGEEIILPKSHNPEGYYRDI
jgi:hypothetical protein